MFIIYLNKIEKIKMVNINIKSAQQI